MRLKRCILLTCGLLFSLQLFSINHDEAKADRIDVIPAGEEFLIELFSQAGQKESAFNDTLEQFLERLNLSEVAFAKYFDGFSVQYNEKKKCYETNLDDRFVIGGLSEVTQVGHQHIKIWRSKVINEIAAELNDFLSTRLKSAPPKILNDIQKQLDEHRSKIPSILNVIRSGKASADHKQELVTLSNEVENLTAENHRLAFPDRQEMLNIATGLMGNPQFLDHHPASEKAKITVAMAKDLVERIATKKMAKRDSSLQQWRKISTDHDLLPLQNVFPEEILQQGGLKKLLVFEEQYLKNEAQLKAKAQKCAELTLVMEVLLEKVKNILEFWSAPEAPIS